MNLYQWARFFRRLGIGRDVGTHDYTIRVPGHDYTFEPLNGGLGGSMMGWGCGIRTGDYLILANGRKTTRYRVRKIDYFADPPDMWGADVEFAPRFKETEHGDS